MKKKITSLMLICCTMFIIACSKDKEPIVSEITISETSDLELQSGEISSVITFGGGDGKNYEIKSSAPSIATVSKSEKSFTIEAKGEGSAVITITSAGKNKSLKVNVVVPVIKLSEDTLTLEIGDTKEITISGEKLKNITVTSENNTVASVTKKDNSKFSVEAKSEGTSKIIVQSGTASKTLIVNVKKKNVLIKSITFDTNQEFIRIGSTSKLNPTIMPEDATNKTLIWESSDPSVVSVNKNTGEVKIGRIAGKRATITAKAQDGSGAQGEITITASQLVNSISFTLENNRQLSVGAEEQVQIDIEPVNANPNVSWESSNPSVVSVDEHGNIKALKEGDAIITVTANDGSYASNRLEITVVTEADGIKFDINPLNVKSRTTTPLTLSLYYEGKKVKTLTKDSEQKKFLRFISNSRGIAEVNDNLELITHKAGETKIIAIYNDGRSEEMEATLEVKVESN